MALLVNSGSPAGYTLKDQGAGCANDKVRAGNKFIGNTKGITDYLQTNWNYYAFTGGSNTVEFPFLSTSNFGLSNCNFSTTADATSQCDTPLSCRPAGAKGTLSPDIFAFRALKADGLRYEVEAQVLLNNIIHIYKETDDEAGLINFLETEGDNEARKLLIPIYIERGEYAKATAALTALTIPTVEKTAYQDYFGVLAAMHHDQRRPDMLSPTELQTVNTLAAGELEVSGYAKALLHAGNYQAWEHLVEDEVDTTSIISFKLPAMPKELAAVTKLMGAAPNPAQQFTIITTFVSDADARNKPTLVLSNMAGKELFRALIKSGTNHTEISTVAMQPGLYFYSLLLNGKVYETEKLSIVK